MGSEGGKKLFEFTLAVRRSHKSSAAGCNFSSPMEVGSLESGLSVIDGEKKS